MSFQPPPSLPLQHLHDRKGSYGAAIALVVVILVLAVIAAIAGRLCSGQSIFGFGHFDFEGWIETKCASCIDGRIESHAPPQAATSQSEAAAAAAENGASGEGV